MENKETKKSVVDNVVVAVLLCDYSPVHVLYNNNNTAFV